MSSLLAKKKALMLGAVAAASPPTINGSEGQDVDSTPVDPWSADFSGQTYTAGDYLLVFYMTTFTATVSTMAGSSDDTYTSILLSNDTDGVVESWEGTVVSTLDTTVDIDKNSTRRSVAGLITISGAAGTGSNPLTSGETSGTSDSPSFPSVDTTGTDQCLVFGAIGTQGSHDLTTLLGALPSGWTFLWSQRTSTTAPTSTVHCTGAVCYKVQATGGATGAGTWSSGLGASVGWDGQTIAIQPA